jgi:heme-degrading monooxygenase HmoA
MIMVVETWRLAPELADGATSCMQVMDDVAGPPAHAHPGWCGHAQFLQDAEDPHTVLVVYPWRSRELHAALVADEEPRLAEFTRRYCAAPREISYFDVLPVDVDEH